MGGKSRPPLVISGSGVDDWREFRVRFGCVSLARGRYILRAGGEQGFLQMAEGSMPGGVQITSPSASRVSLPTETAGGKPTTGMQPNTCSNRMFRAQKTKLFRNWGLFCGVSG